LEQYVLYITNDEVHPSKGDALMSGGYHIWSHCIGEPEYIFDDCRVLSCFPCSS